MRKDAKQYNSAGHITLAEGAGPPRKDFNSCWNSNKHSSCGKVSSSQNYLLKSIFLVVDSILV